MHQFVSQMPYFRSYKSHDIKKLIISLNRVEFGRGMVVIKEGSKNYFSSNDDVFFVLEGEFAEIQTFHLEENDLDNFSKENKLNRKFHKSYER
jgi:hypothetical protein